MPALSHNGRAIHHDLPSGPLPTTVAKSLMQASCCDIGHHSLETAVAASCKEVRRRKSEDKSCNRCECTPLLESLSARHVSQRIPKHQQFSSKKSKCNIYKGLPLFGLLMKIQRQCLKARQTLVNHPFLQRHTDNEVLEPWSGYEGGCSSLVVQEEDKACQDMAYEVLEELCGVQGKVCLAFLVAFFAVALR